MSRGHVDPGLADTEGLWVRVDALGQQFGAADYTPVVTLDGDRTWRLDDAAAYASAVLAVVAAAEHDAALMSSLRAVAGVGDTGLALLLREVRGGHAARPAVEVLPGLRMSAVATLDARAIVYVLPEGGERSQVTAEQARGHAVAALTASHTAQLDRVLYAAAGQFGLDHEGALSLVHSLADHWPAPVAE